MRSTTNVSLRYLVDTTLTGDPYGYEWKIDACNATDLCSSSAPASL